MLYFLDVWESGVKGHHKNWSPCLIVLGHILQGLRPGDGLALVMAVYKCVLQITEKHSRVNNLQTFETGENIYVLCFFLHTFKGFVISRIRDF